jgi:hypothetical protein
MYLLTISMMSSAVCTAISGVHKGFPLLIVIAIAQAVAVMLATTLGLHATIKDSKRQESIRVH